MSHLLALALRMHVCNSAASRSGRGARAEQYVYLGNGHGGNSAPPDFIFWKKKLLSLSLAIDCSSARTWPQ